MLAEARDAKAGLEDELARAWHAMEITMSSRTRDTAERQFQAQRDMRVMANVACLSKLLS